MKNEWSHVANGRFPAYRPSMVSNRQGPTTVVTVYKHAKAFPIFTIKAFASLLLVLFPMVMASSAFSEDLKYNPADNKLLIAVMNGDLKGVSERLTSGDDINEPGPGGFTPLLLAVHTGQTSIVDLFLSLDAEVDAQLDDGVHGLQFAKIQGVVALMQMKRAGSGKASALMFASSSGDFESVDKLLNHNANPNLKATGGITALHFAAWGGHARIVGALIDQGAIIDAQMEDGTTPFDLAKEREHSLVLEALLGRGGN